MSRIGLTPHRPLQSSPGRTVNPLLPQSLCRLQVRCLSLLFSSLCVCVCGFVIILHILFNATIVSCLSCSAAKKLNFFAVCGCTFLVAVKHLSFLPFLAKRDKRFLAMLLLVCCRVCWLLVSPTGMQMQRDTNNGTVCVCGLLFDMR